MSILIKNRLNFGLITTTLLILIKECISNFNGGFEQGNIGDFSNKRVLAYSYLDSDK